MRISVVGLGKLGMPVALAMEHVGHNVMGYDIDPERMQKDAWPFQERDIDGNPSLTPRLQRSDVEFGALEGIVRHGDIVFVAVQTPHAPEYEGVMRLPTHRIDFDYIHLEQAVRAIDSVAEPGQVVAIMSTVLPGTLRERVLPRLENLRIVYNPSFIAMGTTMRDFLDPEFVLIGSDGGGELDIVRRFYHQTVDASIITCTIEEAEAIKVFYNTFITAKIVFANTVMEACHKLGNCDVDVVMEAITSGYRRITSHRYMQGGMGDGGSCHPRDNIALSYLARKLNLSYDLFDNLMLAREKQAEWLCRLVAEHSHLPMAILGTAFKAESNIETGSASLLCKHILEGWGYQVATYDPYVSDEPFTMDGPHVILIGTNHAAFADYCFPTGSVVIDPWRMMGPQDGVTVIGVGKA